jgi:valyl-tRNA synthetase
MELAAKYTPSDIEDKWYSHWTDKGYFKSQPDEREQFSIVIPPPNVTGVLHMGHMLNNTIQDILIRKARLDGKNACWVPGTDHASIATEAKVVRWLRDEKGLKKSDLSREEFLQYAWQWKEKYGGIILSQLKKLGSSCDWDRTSFTMDEGYSKDVIKVFVELYRRGKLYRDYRMINWDPEAQTVLSNEEVIYGEEMAQLHYVKYQVEGTEEFIVIATQRPETIMGDSAVAVNPKDERYLHLHGKRVIVPLVNRSVPIICDDYVDKEFGTGALKVTPAHDPNDYELGKKHNLETIATINPDGKLNEKAVFFVGEDRFVARKMARKALQEAGLLEKVEDYKTNIGRSERTNSVVEPMLSLQWYVDMKALAGPALENVVNDTIDFIPKQYKNTYRHWMENIRDWCISRQLWWGHRIPAWYYEDKIFVAETAEEALAQAQNEIGKHLTINDLRQDEDVLDTWASSWLWPISVFGGFNENSQLSYYYPTSVLVTGWDIIFLWVARMIMAGYEFKGEKPFHKVIFTGMVRDKQGRKMSKSLGNSPDALGLIADFGADGVRFGVLSSTPSGGDLKFDEKLCENGRNFCNKMWNALRLIKGWEVAEDAENEAVAKVNALAAKWLNDKMDKVLASIENDMEQSRLSDALITLYKFIWDDFCSWYLEMIKPTYGKPIDRLTLDRTIAIYEKMMILLHPFMPFITEEIWHQLRNRQAGNDVCIASYPKAGPFNEKFINKVEAAKEVITKIRETRNANAIKMAEQLTVFIQADDNAKEIYAQEGILEMVKKLGNLATFEFGEEPKNAVSFISNTEKYFVVLEKEIDTEAETKKIQEELEYQRGFLVSVDKKLSNERFVAGAPAQVIENERKKKADAEARIKILEESLAKLS